MVMGLWFYIQGSDYRVCKWVRCLSLRGLFAAPTPVPHRGEGEWLRHPTLRYSGLADAAFQFQLYQPLCFDRKFHRQFLEDFFAEAVDDEADRVFFGESALHAVENLVFADFCGGRFVFDLRRRVLHHQVRKGVRAAVAADEQGVAL